MSDIVDELRQGSLNNDDYRWKAADEIERMRAALQRLRRSATPMMRGWIDLVLMEKEK